MINIVKSLQDHRGFQKYFKNTSWLIGEKILRMLVGLSVGIWVARYLGPGQFGLLNYAISFVGLFIYIATFGIDGIVVHRLVQDESKRNVLLGTAFLMKVTGALIVLVILSLAVHLTENDALTNTLIFIIATATIFQSFNVIDFYFQSKVLGKYSVFINSIALFIVSIVKILLILNRAPLVYFAWVMLLDSIVLALGYIYFYYRHNLLLKGWKFSSATAMSLLRDCWPLMMGGLMASIYLRIDQVMIMHILGTESVGQYAAAVRLSETWYFVPVVVAASLFPAIIGSKQKSADLYRDRLQKFYKLMTWLALSVALPITFFSDWIVNLLYGSDYQAAGRVLMIHIWTGVFVFMGVASAKWLIVEGLQILEVYRSLFGLIANVSLNYILIPRLGITGAAVATLCSHFIASYLIDYFHPKTRETFYMKSRALNFFKPI